MTWPIRALPLLALALLGVLAGPAQGVPCNPDNPGCDPGPTTVTRTLTVTAPTQGSVTGTGINCPGDCSQSYQYDPEVDDPPTVSLSASGGPAGYSPDWSGCTQVVGDQCEAEMSQNRTVGVTWRDSQAPTVSLVSPASKAGPATSFHASATDNSGSVAQYRFFVDGVQQSGTGSTFNFNPGPFAHGSSHTIAVRAFDAAGNQSNLASHTFTVDKQANLTNVTSVPAVVSQQPTISFTKDADMGGASCSTLQPGGATATTSPCSSPYSPTGGAGDGQYTVTLSATDDVGNSVTVQRVYTLDTVAPSLSITSPTSGEVRNPGFTPSYAMTDANGATVTCKLDGGAYAACGPVSGSPGAHTLFVRAVDPAGNETVRSVGFAFTGGSTGTGGGGSGGAGGDTGGPSGPTAAQLAAALDLNLKAAAKSLRKLTIAKLLKKGRFRVKGLQALAAGKFEVVVTGAGKKGGVAKAATIAKASKTIGAAGTTTVSVKLTKQGRRLLRRARRAKLRLSLRFTPTGAARESSSKRVTLKRG